MTAIDQLTRSGIKVIGYINTDYGKIPIETITSDKEKWETFYGILAGYFFDLVSSGSDDIEHYTAVSNLIRANNQLVFFNPGTTPDEGYTDISDTILVLENTHQEFNENWRYNVPSLVGENKYWAAMLHSMPQNSDGSGNLYALIEAIQFLGDHNIGYLFFADVPADLENGGFLGPLSQVMNIIILR